MGTRGVCRALGLLVDPACSSCHRVRGGDAQSDSSAFPRCLCRRADTRARQSGNRHHELDPRLPRGSAHRLLQRRRPGAARVHRRLRRSDGTLGWRGRVRAPGIASSVERCPSATGRVVRRRRRVFLGSWNASHHRTHFRAAGGSVEGFSGKAGLGSSTRPRRRSRCSCPSPAGPCTSWG